MELQSDHGRRDVSGPNVERLIASVDCALGPLWNPVRLAEDIALVDNMSRGRLHTTVGLGYRTVEYDSLGVDFTQRGKLMDGLVERMLSIWAGADPDAGVCTGTWTRPHPPLYVGGGARATARRAARFGLPLSLADHLPDIDAYYRELCADADIKPFVIMPGATNRGMIYPARRPGPGMVRAGRLYPLGGSHLRRMVKRRAFPDAPAGSADPGPGQGIGTIPVSDPRAAHRRSP